jgi:hypothetical protein
MPDKLFIIAACGSLIATVLHLACIVLGERWYRLMGAGEHMAKLAAAGHPYPTVVTSAISLVLLVWSCYALSGAGVIRPLPFLKAVLVLISLVLLARGLLFPLLMPLFPGNSLTFWYLSSAICLLLGSCFAMGSWQSWHRL